MRLLDNREKAEIILDTLAEGVLNVDWNRKEYYLRDIILGLEKIYCIEYAHDDVHEYNDCINDDE